MKITRATLALAGGGSGPRTSYAPDRAAQYQLQLNGICRAACTAAATRVTCAAFKQTTLHSVDNVWQSRRSAPEIVCSR